MSVPAAKRARPGRGRRSARLSGDDRQLAILATAERLLEHRSLADISVNDLAQGAGISRPTFYFYFRSKDAVLLTLLERMIADADAALEILHTRSNSWRSGIAASYQTFGSESRGVSRAGWAALATNPEARQLWSTFMQKRVRQTVTVIEAERTRGAATETLPAEDLATALNQMNERVLAASFAADEPSVSPACMVDTLLHIWVASIYSPAGQKGRSGEFADNAQAAGVDMNAVT